MGMQLNVAAFTVTIGIMLVRPSIQMAAETDADKVNDGKQIQKNLRRLFDSIAKNDMKNSDAYRNILQGEAMKEQQAFDSVKQVFRFKRPRNTDEQKDYVHRKVSAVKRDTHSSSTFRPVLGHNFRDLFPAVTRGDLATVKRLIAEGLPAATADHNGMTAAHVAAKAGHVAILDYLLSEDSSLLSARDKVGQNLLYVATVKGRTEIVKYLVDNCSVDVLHADNIRNKNTAVHVAAQEGHIDLLKYFLEKKHIDPNVLNEKGESPVFSAAGNKKLPVIVYLVDKHDVNLQLLDSKNRNLLFPAAMKGDIAMFQYVLDEKKVNLQIDWADDERRTVLHWAALSNLLKMTQYLVEKKGANVNALDLKKQTSLHLAALAGHIRLVEYLYRKGADPTLPDADGKKPVDLAKEKEVIRFLEEYPKPHVELTTSPSTTVLDRDRLHS